jgi:hypothetical protein
VSAGCAKPIASLGVGNFDDAVLPDCTLWVWVPTRLNLVTVFAKLLNPGAEATATRI